MQSSEDCEHVFLGGEGTNLALTNRRYKAANAALFVRNANLINFPSTAMSESESEFIFHIFHMESRVLAGKCQLHEYLF